MRYGRLRGEVHIGREERFIAQSLLAGRLIVIAHAAQDDGTRIISMRKGNRREQEIYQKRLGSD